MPVAPVSATTRTGSKPTIFDCTPKDPDDDVFNGGEDYPIDDPFGSDPFADDPFNGAPTTPPDDDEDGL